MNKRYRLHTVHGKTQVEWWLWDLFIQRSWSQTPGDVIAHGITRGGDLSRYRQDLGRIEMTQSELESGFPEIVMYLMEPA